MLNIINIDEETLRTSTEVILSKFEEDAINGINEFIEKLQEKHSNVFNEYIKSHSLESLFELLKKYPNEKSIVQRMNKILIIGESDICNKTVLLLLGILFYIMYIFSIKLSYFSLESVL